MITKREWHQGENWRYIYDNKGIIIATVDDIAIRDIRENLANAQLIAAAPDMYEALKYIYNHPAWAEDTDNITMVSKVLTKAEGNR